MLDQDIIFRLVLSLLLIITGAGTAAALIIAGTCAALIIAGAGIIRVSACRLICIITGVITGVVAGVAGVITGIAGVVAGIAGVIAGVAGVIAGVAGVAALGTRIIILIRLGLMLLHKTDGLGNISRLGHIH